MTQINIQFQYDREAGKVYGVLRRLKSEGYFQTFNIYDNYAEVIVGSEDADAVLNVFNDLQEEGYRGIHADVPQ